MATVIGRCHAASEQPADEGRFRRKLRVAPSGLLMDASFLLLKFMCSRGPVGVAVGESLQPRGKTGRRDRLRVGHERGDF